MDIFIVVGMHICTNVQQMKERKTGQERILKCQHKESFFNLSVRLVDKIEFRVMSNLKNCKHTLIISRLRRNRYQSFTARNWAFGSPAFTTNCTAVSQSSFLCSSANSWYASDTISGEALGTSGFPYMNLIFQNSNKTHRYSVPH